MLRILEHAYPLRLLMEYQPNPIRKAPSTPSRSRWSHVMLGAALLAACSEGPTNSPKQRTPSAGEDADVLPVASLVDGSAASAPDGGAQTDSATIEAETRPPGCTAPDGMSGTPGTLLEAVALINALPKPTTIACLLESLDRPLRLYATNSVFSAQPAESNADPRVFVMMDPLILSIVTAGESSLLLELSELTSNTRSLKAEIQFPVTGAVTDEMLVEQIEREGGTICQFCHGGETEYFESYEGARESVALRPSPSLDVSLESLRLEAERCDEEETPERCEIMDALFDYGSVSQGVFPPEMRLFF